MRELLARVVGAVDGRLKGSILAEDLGLGFAVWDVRSDRIWWSPGLYALLGRDADDYKPTVATVQDLVHPDDRDAVAGALARALEEIGPVSVDQRVLTPGGERTLEIRGTVEAGRDGRPRRVHMVVRDVTEGRRRRLHLEAVERRLSDAQRIARMGSWEWRPANRSLQFSDEMYALCGVGPATFAHTIEDWASLAVEADRRVFEEIAALDPWEQPAGQWTCRIMAPDTGLVELRLSAEAIPDDPPGAGFRVLGTAQDVTDAARVVRALRREERLLVEAQRLGRIGSWTYQPQTQRLEWSSAMFGLHGRLPGEMQASLALTVPGLTPDDRRRLERAVADVGETGRRAELEFRVADGGEERTFTVGIQRIRAEEGPWEIIGVVQDQTALRRQQSALLHYESLVRSADDAIVGLSTEGVVVSWNPAAERLFGFRVADAVGRPIGELTATGTDAPSAYELALESNAMTFDETRRRPDGSEVELHVAMTRVRDRDGAVAGHSMVVRDVTEHNRASREFRETKEQLDALLRHSPALVSLKDVEGRYLLVSTSFANANGLPASAFPGRTDPEVFTHQVAARLARHDQDLLRRRSPLTIEETLPLSDGTVRTYLTLLFALHNGNGPYAIGRFATDVTELREAEAAKRANEAKTQLLSRVSHELRTPLNAILGFAQLVQDEEAAHYITKAGSHLRRLIDELLDVARAETDEFKVELEPVDVLGVVEEATDLLQPLAHENAVRVEMPARTDHSALVDRSRLRQILLNLVGNAIKHNDAGGRVSIRIDGGAETIRIVVADDGPGIPPHLLERAFEPFQRLGAERRGLEGVGLGLSLSRGFAERMGGRLVLTSDGRSGTEAILELPAASVSTAPAPLSPSADPGARVTIDGVVLYIEDSPSNIALMQRLVGARTTAQLEIARDAATGVALARSERPAVILLDLHLPDATGEEVLATLRASPETEDIPVVVVSADASEERARSLVEQGARDYVTKPVDIGQLTTILRETCAGQAGRSN